MNSNKQKLVTGCIHQQIDLSVMPVGFQSMDIERFKKIFHLVRGGGRSYTILPVNSKERFNILLVNFDNPSAVREKDQFLKNHADAQLVAVSRGPLREPPAHHIRGMLMAERVFGVLDKIEVETSESDSTLERFPPALACTVTEPRLDCVSKRIVQEPHLIQSSIQSNCNDGYRALVVDDSLAIQKSLELNLATLKQISTIDFADNGEMALQMADLIRYDLIFLDIMMPGIDGYETCSRLRKKTEYKKTPIIMVSGKTSPMDEVKGIMAGATTYLTKPVQTEQFQKLGIRVLTWLEEHKIKEQALH